MLEVGAILRLARLDSSFLVFLSVFVPLVARTGSLDDSFRWALPLLFISACAFICNDLDDIESDRVNHPDRPLPSGDVTPFVASLIYFVCLAGALFTTRTYVDDKFSFWYYALLTLVISYGYVVDHLQNIKPIYVAALSTAPILILTQINPGEGRLYLAMLSIFFLVTSRELCMDFMDREGDNPSIASKLNTRSVALISFSGHALGLSLLVPLLKTSLSVLALACMTLLSVLSAIFWVSVTRARISIFLMKMQLFLGLNFLL